MINSGRVARIGLLCLIGAFTGCGGGGQPLVNGEALADVSGKAGSKRFMARLPAGPGALLVQTSRQAGVSIVIRGAGGVDLRRCDSGEACGVDVSAGGTVFVDLEALQDYSGLALSSAWGSSPETVTLADDSRIVLPALSGGQTGLQSLFNAGASSGFSLDIGPPSSGSGTADLLDNTGVTIASCALATRCSVTDAPPGVMFLRMASTSGMGPLAVAKSPGRIDLSGVWVYTEGAVDWPELRGIFSNILEIVASTVSNPTLLVDSFRLIIDDFLRPFEVILRQSNSEFMISLGKFLDAVFANFTGGLAELRQRVNALPSRMSFGPRLPCTAAREGATYLEFSHDANTKRYTMAGGTSGKGAARDDAGCHWFGSNEPGVVIEEFTGRLVNSEYFQRFLVSQGGNVGVSFESANRIRLNMPADSLPEYELILSRLICAAANLPERIFDKIREFEGGLTLVATVPDPVGSKSGVTVSAGFDLGTRSESELVGLGFPPELVTLLRPYLGLKKMAALIFLKAHPLSISTDQALLIHQKSKKQSLTTLVKDYAKDAKIDFCGVPERWQTVISSVQFQYGSARSRTPSFWKAVSEQRWNDALAILRDFHDNYPTRRHKEADYAETN